MSDIEFNCPKCKKLLVVDEKGGGRLIKCPDCRCSLMIPRRKPASAATPLPPPEPPPVPPAVIPTPPAAQSQPPPPVVPAPPSPPVFSLPTAARTPAPATAPPLLKCPKCETVLPKPDARFCMTCGTMLRRPEPGPDVVRHEQIAQSFREKKSKLLDTRYESSSEPPTEGPIITEAPSVCPYCKNKLNPDAIICVACGRNLRTGRRLSTARRNPLKSLGRFFSAVMGLFGILLKGIVCVIAVIVIILAGRTFFKEEPAPASADKSAPPVAGQPRAPTEALEQIIEVTEPPGTSTNSSEPGKEVTEPSGASTNSTQSGKVVTEQPGSSATNSVPEKPVVEAPAVIAKPPVAFQEEELTGIVNEILTSWRDHTQAYEKHLITGYSSGQVTSPINWQIRSVQRDRKNPDDLLITVFVRNATPQGKTYSAEWTFKFRLENNMWRLARFE